MYKTGSLSATLYRSLDKVKVGLWIDVHFTFQNPHIFKHSLPLCPASSWINSQRSKYLVLSLAQDL